MNKNSGLRKDIQLQSFSQEVNLPLVNANICRSNGLLTLHFTLSNAERVNFSLPEIDLKARNMRMDRLWQYTCFEVFLASSDHEGYLEYNFSPTGAWQCYRFTHYRRPDPPQEALVENPTIVIHSQYHYSFTLKPGEANLFNVCAVLLDKKSRSYLYSVKHLFNQPDFHHRKNFFALD